MGRFPVDGILAQTRLTTQVPRGAIKPVLRPLAADLWEENRQ